MGESFLLKKNYSDAKKHFQQAIQLSENISGNPFLPAYQLNYGKTLYHFEQYDSAKVYLNTSLRSFKAVKNTDKIIEALNWLALTNEKVGENENAFSFYNEALMWKDTLLNEKK